jgi:hypothetical protein
MCIVIGAYYVTGIRVVQELSRDTETGRCEKKRRKGKKLISLSYGPGEEFYEFHRRRGERTYRFWRK